MRIHLRGLLVAALFVGLVLVAVDARIGVAAIVAATVIDWLAFALPLGSGRDREDAAHGAD
jgi:hypothetical protein